MPRQKSDKKPSFGVLFWIAFILFVAILYLANHQRIQEVLERTHFVDIVFEDPVPQDTPPEEAPEETDRETGMPEQTPPEETAPEEPAPVPEEEPPPEDTQEPEEISVLPDTPEQTAPEQTGPEQRRRTGLYYIRVSNDGRILAEEVERTISFADAPLTATINALLAGPGAEDLNAGFLSLIPEGTALISARVSDRVAFLNFNEAFRFNPMGLEGYMAQMQQVVLTATQFSTVDAVQILINGRTLDYLGGDGVYIGEPLTASDLRR